MSKEQHPTCSIRSHISSRDRSFSDATFRDTQEESIQHMVIFDEFRLLFVGGGTLGGVGGGTLLRN